MGEKKPGIDEIARICSTCGACLSECPVYQAVLTEPQSPRGKINLIKALGQGRLKSTAFNKKLLYHCLLCGSCQNACTQGVEFVEMMVQYRNRLSGGQHIPLFKKLVLAFYQSLLFKKGLWVLDLLARTPLQKHLGIPRRQKADLKKYRTVATPGQKYDILLFPGCVLTYFYPRLIEKIILFLTKAGYSVALPPDLECCGFPFLTQGWQEKFNALRQKNRQIFSAFDFRYLVVPCGTGAMAFKQYYDWPGQEIFELTEFIYRFCPGAAIPEKTVLAPGGPAEKFTYHDPCHDLKSLKIKKEPRHFLEQFGESFIDDKQPLCCGFGGIFRIGFPATAQKILARKAGHLKELGVGGLFTSCPGCYLHLRENLPLDVRFFIELFD